MNEKSEKKYKVIKVEHYDEVSNTINNRRKYLVYLIIFLLCFVISTHFNTEINIAANNISALPDSVLVKASKFVTNLFACSCFGYSQAFWLTWVKEGYYRMKYEEELEENEAKQLESKGLVKIL